MSLEQLQNWAQAQINNTTKPEVRPDIGISVLQLVDELERLQDYVKDKTSKFNTTKDS